MCAGRASTTKTLSRLLKPVFLFSNRGTCTISPNFQPTHTSRQHLQVSCCANPSRPRCFCLSGLFAGHDQAHALGQEVFQKLADRVGSRQEVIEMSWISSGRVTRFSKTRGSSWVRSGSGRNVMGQLGSSQEFYKIRGLSWVRSGDDRNVIG